MKVSGVVAAKAANAPGGDVWVRHLPSRVRELCGLWGLRVVENLTGGTAAG